MASHPAGVVALATALALAPVADSAEPSLLEGRTFQGELRDARGMAQATDLITFDNGRFLSLTCERMGFGATPYWSRSEGNDVHFLVEAAHPEHGRLRIVGLVRGEQLQADGEWTKERWYWTVRERIRFEAAEKR